jgi:hypothetical protein
MTGLEVSRRKENYDRIIDVIDDVGQVRLLRLCTTCCFAETKVVNDIHPTAKYLFLEELCLLWYNVMSVESQLTFERRMFPVLSGLKNMPSYKPA